VSGADVPLDKFPGAASSLAEANLTRRPAGGAWPSPQRKKSGSRRKTASRRSTGDRKPSAKKRTPIPSGSLITGVAS